MWLRISTAFLTFFFFFQNSVFCCFMCHINWWLAVKEVKRIRPWKPNKAAYARRDWKRGTHFVCLLFFPPQPVTWESTQHYVTVCLRNQSTRTSRFSSGMIFSAGKPLDFFIGTTWCHTNLKKTKKLIILCSTQYILLLVTAMHNTV